MHLRHDWQEVARVFNPPSENARGLEAKGDPLAVADMVEKALHGFTSLEYVCGREGCDKRKVTEVIGRIPERDADH